jgi:hypothetical protein
MLKGQTLRVEALTHGIVTLASGIAYEVGPAKHGHERHPQLAVGQILVVFMDSTPSGDTLVTMPCGCDLLLFAKPN